MEEKVEELGLAAEASLLSKILQSKKVVEFNDMMMIIRLLSECREGDDIFQVDYINATYERYLTFRRALASFLSVDLDSSKSLDNSELKTLLWLCNGEEPSNERV